MLRINIAANNAWPQNTDETLAGALAKAAENGFIKARHGAAKYHCRPQRLPSPEIPRICLKRRKKREIPKPCRSKAL